MRTVLTIAKEAVKALEEANKHYNECNTCRQEPNEQGEKSDCIGYHYLLNDAEDLRLEIEEAEATFQQELKERGIEL